MFRVYSTKEFPGLQASTELTKVNVHYIFSVKDLTVFFFFFFFFWNVKSILLDGGFVSIFEKLKEDDERREVLVQSIIFLIIASGSVLKLLVGLLVKMFEPSNNQAHPQKWKSFFLKKPFFRISHPDDLKKKGLKKIMFFVLSLRCCSFN